MELRPHTDDDLVAIATIYVEAVHGLTGELYDDAQREAWAPRSVDTDRWRSRLDGLHVRVADRDGRVLGFVAWKADGYLDLLYTHPDAARTGVATRLVEVAEADVRGRGGARMWVQASDLSRPLFAKRGYTVVREEELEVRGALLRSTTMETVLEPASTEPPVEPPVQPRGR